MRRWRQRAEWISGSLRRAPFVRLRSCWLRCVEWMRAPEKSEHRQIAPHAANRCHCDNAASGCRHARIPGTANQWMGSALCRLRRRHTLRLTNRSTYADRKDREHISPTHPSSLLSSAATLLCPMYASLHMPGGGGASGSSFTALGSSARSASSLARAIRAEEYSLRNRIKSLIDDRAFVATVRRDYPSLPLFANLRCGVWYVESCSSSVAGDASAAASPAAASSGGNGTAAEACYFKSTDGHAHHWKFSAARLNVHVLQRIIQHAQSGANSADGGETTVAVASPRCSGALFVDSTRKGKRFPDSFSRTMPIWCAVWNRALLEVRQRAANATAAAGADSPDTSASDAAWDTALHMPLWVRSVSTPTCSPPLSDWYSLHFVSNSSVVARTALHCCLFDLLATATWRSVRSRSGCRASSPHC